MWKWILDHLKIIAIVGLVIGFLIIFGNVLNALIPWHWLTDIFSFGKFMIQQIDFILDTNTLIILIGLMFIIAIAYWGFKGAMTLIHWFKKY